MLIGDSNISHHWMKYIAGVSAATWQELRLMVWNQLHAH